MHSSFRHRTIERVLLSLPDSVLEIVIDLVPASDVYALSITNTAFHAMCKTRLAHLHGTVYPLAWRRGYRKGHFPDIDLYLRDERDGWVVPEHYCQIERNPLQNGDGYWFSGHVPNMRKWVNGIRHYGSKCLIGPACIAESDWRMLETKYGFQRHSVNAASSTTS